MNKSVNAKMARSLLEDGRIHVSGLYSRKKNRTFSADLVLDDTGTYVNYRLEFLLELDDHSPRVRRLL